MDFKTNIPIYLQVIEDMKKQMIGGTLSAGDKLPSTRELAVSYQINPNTAVRVYNEMETMGLCFTKRGLGTFVTEDLAKFDSIKEEMAEEMVREFIKGMTDIGYDKEKILRVIEEYFK